MALGKERARLLTFLFLSLFIYSLSSVKLLTIVLFLSFVLFFLTKTSKRFLKALLFANFFTFFIEISLLIVDFKENFEVAFAIFLKSNSILLLTFSLVLSLGVLNLLKMLEPFIPKKFLFILLLAYRYLYTLKEEYEKLKKSALCRGFEPKFSLSTYRTYGYLLGALTLKSLSKAKEVYKSAILRGLEN